MTLTLRSELFYYWPLLRNNNMATNFRRCTSSYGGRRFAACNYWTQTSWQAMLRDSNWWQRLTFVSFVKVFTQVREVSDQGVCLIW